MKRMKWRGTILFVVILTVLGLTVGLRLYGTGTAPHAVTLTPNPSAATPAASAPAATATPGATAAPTAAAAPTTKKVDGAVEQTPYGPIQVEVTFTGTKITAVTELQAPNDSGRSVEINAQAGPMLAQEVLSSQSAKIDTVSGATYTSDGYAQSVQSAIDKS